MNRRVMIAVIAVIGIIWIAGMASAFAGSTTGGYWGGPIIGTSSSWDRGGWVPRHHHQPTQ